MSGSTGGVVFVQVSNGRSLEVPGYASAYGDLPGTVRPGAVIGLSAADAAFLISRRFVVAALPPAGP